MRRFARDRATEALLADFLGYQQAVLGLAPFTLRNHESGVRNFAVWLHLHGPGDFAAVTSADVEAWLIAETDRGVRPRTRESSLGALRAFYRWFAPDGPNPAAQVARPRVPPRAVAPYRPDDAEVILGGLAARDSLSAAFDHAVVATLRWTGMRAGELTGLRRDRLDLERRRAKVIGKGSQPRLVPVPRVLAAILSRYLDEFRPQSPASPYVFANPRGLPGSAHVGRVDTQGVTDLCRRAGQATTVAGPHHPHRWRHSYATELLRAGVDLHVVQRLLGHRHLETTTRYLHLVDQDLRRAVDRTYPATTSAAATSTPATS